MRIKSNVTQLQTWLAWLVPLAWVGLASFQVWAAWNSTRPDRAERLAIAAFYVAIAVLVSAINVWAQLVARRRVVEIDDVGIRSTPRPGFDLKWDEIGRMEVSYSTPDSQTISVARADSRVARSFAVPVEQLQGFSEFCARHGRTLLTRAGDGGLVTSTLVAFRWGMFGKVAAAATAFGLLLCIPLLLGGRAPIWVLLTLFLLPVAAVVLPLVVAGPQVHEVSADDTGVALMSRRRNAKPGMRFAHPWEAISSLVFTPGRVNWVTVKRKPNKPGGKEPWAIRYAIEPHAIQPLAELARRHGVPVTGP